MLAVQSFAFNISNICVGFPGIMDPTYPLVPTANVIACVLVVIPLFHMVDRSWNTGVFGLAIWIALQSISKAVNSIIWSSDTEDRAPVWCDICKSPTKSYAIRDNYKFLKASHLGILVNTGIPACSYIITRKLYVITRLQAATRVSKRQGSNFFYRIL